MPKVHIVGGGQGGYSGMFLSAGWELESDFTEADMVQFTGGEDVSPWLYGEQDHRTTHASGRRDLEEAGYFAITRRMGIPMSGICRGGQFLNVMSGGKMYQHVSKHATGATHKLYDADIGLEVNVSSTHHQMMRAGPGGLVYATARLGGFKQYMGEHGVVECNDPDEPDTEVVYYPETKCLCFQPHPEFFRPDHECFKYYFDVIERVHGLRA